MDTYNLKERWIDKHEFVVVENIPSEPPRMVEVGSDCSVGEVSSSLCSQQDNNRSNETPHHDPQVVGAGVATGLCGMLVGGPLLAMCFGLGTGYAAEHDHKTPVGRTARRIGDFALQTEDEASKLNRKHHISETVNNWANHVWTATVTAWSSVNNCTMDFWYNLRDNCGSAQKVDS